MKVIPENGLFGAKVQGTDRHRQWSGLSLWLTWGCSLGRRKKLAQRPCSGDTRWMLSDDDDEVLERVQRRTLKIITELQKSIEAEKKSLKELRLFNLEERGSR